ncbi:hypothetical protein QQG55_31335 [Brugia pahangi]
MSTNHWQEEKPLLPHLSGEMNEGEGDPAMPYRTTRTPPSSLFPEGYLEEKLLANSFTPHTHLQSTKIFVYGEKMKSNPEKYM